MCIFNFGSSLKFFGANCLIFELCGEASVLTISPQENIKKEKIKSSFFCGHCMADGDDHNFLPRG